MGNIYWLPRTKNPADGLTKVRSEMAPLSPQLESGKFCPGPLRPLKGIRRKQGVVGNLVVLAQFLAFCAIHIFLPLVGPQETFVLFLSSPVTVWIRNFSSWQKESSRSLRRMRGKKATGRLFWGNWPYPRGCSPRISSGRN